MSENTKWITIDGNEAAARVAYKLNEVIAIYPITPASPMGEWADEWASQRRPNLWGAVPLVTELQAESGAAGAVHGALQAGALTTTFTASQGLLLMIPNMYKIAGELSPAVIHVAARSIASQALSIFGDHSDVMAARNTGFAFLASASAQEAQDFAAIATAASLRSRIPFVHFFDGFRTSHEINKIRLLDDSELRALIQDEWISAHRGRALDPDRPVVRGTAQNPDVFFQARESANPYYAACPGVVQACMDEFAARTGRSYHLFDYEGDPQATRVLVIMGSGGDTVAQLVRHMNTSGEKVGLLRVRLYRPFDVAAFLEAIPPSTRAIAVLDRTKEPGSTGEPLYLDVQAALSEAAAEGQSALEGPVRVIGGRYGLSSKEFTPAMVKAIFEELNKDSPKNHFTIGIRDDVSMTSLEFDPTFQIEPEDTVRALFYGLGADGTVSANMNSIKIIGEQTPRYAQGYFVYDSKKSGSRTVSHLRFGPEPIQAPYLIQSANFIACHQFDFVEKFDVLRVAAPGATFLLNSPYPPDEVWNQLPRSTQEQILEKKLEFYVIDAYRVAHEAGLGLRINTVMQTCFFALSGVLPEDEAIAAIKDAIEKTYGRRGKEIIELNFEAVDSALRHLSRVDVPAEATSDFERAPVVPMGAPNFVQRVTAPLIEGLGDELPVSAFPVDGTYPAGTTKFEKRNIAAEVPVWDEQICIQCGKCVFVCPHAVIRQKLAEPGMLETAPGGFKSAPARFREFKELAYTLQVSVEDCTGCALCFEVCPVKDKAQPKRRALNMEPQRPLREQETANWEFFLQIPEVERSGIPLSQVKYSQLLEPLFEFSGACAGCGETPYLKLLSQLFGDRTLIANATGCSSIYGGNLPTTPWTKNIEGRGPAWSNSLFEDNAEFGFGMRVALDQRLEEANRLLRALQGEVEAELMEGILHADQLDEAGIQAQRARVERLKSELAQKSSPEAKQLLAIADVLVRKSVWIVGGDGWAYDIGFGGLDHVLASGRDVNVLVLDTEVYSNTGGQMSKATPRAAVAKFAAGGKRAAKKDLGLMAMSYGNVYVARVAFGASDTQTLKAFLEADAYPGPSLILAYSHCIAHAYDMRFGLRQQQAAVDSGYWPLYRYNPELEVEGAQPLTLDSKPPRVPLETFMYNEGRFQILRQTQPDVANRLLELAKEDVQRQWETYERLARFNGKADERTETS